MQAVSTEAPRDSAALSLLLVLLGNPSDAAPGQVIGISAHRPSQMH